MRLAFALLSLCLAACGGEQRPFHSHEGMGPNDGMVATFRRGAEAGHLELKLHDDKGDLELWLCRDEAMTAPFDLPLDATIEVEFVGMDGRKVTLRPRDRATNPDEAGRPNVRDGKTNYFIFPGDTGADASWLQGAGFRSDVVVRFASDGQQVATAPFELRPHVH